MKYTFEGRKTIEQLNFDWIFENIDLDNVTRNMCRSHWGPKGGDFVMKLINFYKHSGGSASIFKEEAERLDAMGNDIIKALGGVGKK